MSKATYEDVHGAAEFAERTESNAFYLWHGIERVEDAPAFTSHELCICCLGFGPVFYRYLGDSAVRSCEEKAPSAYAAVVFGPVGTPVVRLKRSTDWPRLIPVTWSPVV